VGRPQFIVIERREGQKQIAPLHFSFRSIIRCCHQAQLIHGSYHFESAVQMTIGEPQTARASWFESVTPGNQKAFVTNHGSNHNWFFVIECSSLDDSSKTVSFESTF
jgi:hypothetical protein